MNPFATGTSAGHAPRRSDGEHEERERAENHGSSREDENGEGTWKRRKDEGESRKGAREKKRKRGETEKWPDRTARRRPRLVIYIESYLHLNVFIFNARPRNGPLHSRRLRFGSSSFAPPQPTFHMLLSRSVSSPLENSFVCSFALKDRRYKRKLAKCVSETNTRFSDAPPVVRVI